MSSRFAYHNISLIQIERIWMIWLKLNNWIALLTNFMGKLNSLSKCGRVGEIPFSLSYDFGDICFADFLFHHCHGVLKYSSVLFSCENWKEWEVKWKKFRRFFHSNNANWSLTLFGSAIPKLIGLKIHFADVINKLIISSLCFLRFFVYLRLYSLHLRKRFSLSLFLYRLIGYKLMIYLAKYPFDKEIINSRFIHLTKIETWSCANAQSTKYTISLVSVA